MLNADFPDIPEFCRIPQEDRRRSWLGRELRPCASTMVIGRTVVRDAGTDRVRQEMEAARALRRERDLAKKRDDEAVRKRGIRNVRIVELAAAGKIAIAPPPVKIVRVVDLSPMGRAPATEETDVKKAAAKKPAKPAAKKARKTDRRQNPTARLARRGSSQTRKALEADRARAAGAGKVDVVAQIAAMMSGPNGASMEEMVKATGIKPHPMRAKIKLVRDRLGYTTIAPGKDNGYRYHAVAPKTEG